MDPKKHTTLACGEFMRPKLSPVVEAQETIAALQAIVRNKTDTSLATWIAEARGSLVAS
jgi:hypothetical protein